MWQCSLCNYSNSDRLSAELPERCGYCNKAKFNHDPHSKFVVPGSSRLTPLIPLPQPSSLAVPLSVASTPSFCPICQQYMLGFPLLGQEHHLETCLWWNAHQKVLMEKQIRQVLQSQQPQAAAASSAKRVHHTQDSLQCACGWEFSDCSLLALRQHQQICPCRHKPI